MRLRLPDRFIEVPRRPIEVVEQIRRFGAFIGRPRRPNAEMRPELV